jgi:hypothetical protein
MATFAAVTWGILSAGWHTLQDMLRRTVEVDAGLLLANTFRILLAGDSRQQTETHQLQRSV